MKTAEEINQLIFDAAIKHKNDHGQDAPVLFTFEKGAQFGYSLASQKENADSPSKEENPYKECAGCGHTLPIGYFERNNKCYLCDVPPPSDSPRWVKIKDREKLQNGFYLTFDPNYPNQPEGIGQYNSYNYSWSNESGDEYHPSHYMLLPSPPNK